MSGLLAVVLGSIKALVLLGIATGITLALKQRAARIRAVVWGTAIAGCLVIPLVAPLVPSWTIPVPAAIERIASRPEQPESVLATVKSARIDPTTAVIQLPEVAVARANDRGPDIDWMLLEVALAARGLPRPGRMPAPGQIALE
jgi:hypothetical protein